RVIMVRATAHGAPPMGGDGAGAIAVAQAEVARANAAWGACGVSFGAPQDLAVTIVDPPKPFLLALGCDHGLPARGGTGRVRADGRELKVLLAKGMLPAAAARVVAAAAENTLGLTAVVSDNSVIGPGAYGSSDVLLRHPGGTLAEIEPPTG